MDLIITGISINKFLNKLRKTIFLFSAFFLMGCSGISLTQKIKSTEQDWIMAGGNSKQQNISYYVLKPTLNFVWSYNCNAGIGYSAISVTDAVVFLNTLQGEMHSIDVSSGGKIGQLNFLGKEANTTPLIDGNNVIIAYGGDNKYSIASYDLSVGEIKWRTNIGYVQTSPILFDDFVYIGSLNGKQYKLDKSSGKLIWTYKTNSAVHSTCCVYENKVIFGTDNGILYCINANDGTFSWKFKTSGSVFSTPLAYENMVFFGSYDSNYYCVDINSGKSLWSRNLSTKIFSGSTLYKNNSLIFGGIDGNLYCLNLKDGSLKWKFNTNGVIASTPLTSGEYVYFSSYDYYTYCIDGNEGKLVWKYEMDGKGKTSPVIWGNYLFTASDNYLYCFTDKITNIK